MLTRVFKATESQERIKNKEETSQIRKRDDHGRLNFRGKGKWGILARHKEVADILKDLKVRI